MRIRQSFLLAFGKEKGESMITEKFNMEVVAVGSDDGKRTYEMYRKWQNEGRKALVISLYPTISTENPNRLDLSTMHILNHVGDFGWNEMIMVNLYSTVFEGKPLVSQLNEDDSNMAYIEEILERENIHEYDIVIAWGSTLNSHKKTINLKIDILSMLQEKGLSENVKCIVTENLDTRSEFGTHPLYLGLHFARDKWVLYPFPLKNALNELENSIQPTVTVEKTKKGGKKNVSKTNE